MRKLMLERKKYKDSVDKIFEASNESIKKENNLQDFKIDLSEIVTNKKFNVLMFGIDSVSKKHFKRIFPKTLSFLSNKLSNNIIYENYNSIGVNTFPNLVPMLSGVVDEPNEILEMKSEIVDYKEKNYSFFDTFPFLWNDYESMGYLTHLNQDLPSIAFLNYLKNGFRYRPTSFYSRPFWVKYYSTKSGPRYCHYKKPTYVTYIEMLDTFLSRMIDIKENSDIPFFSFNFLTEYTHDQLAVPPDLDNTFHEMLSSYDQKGCFNNTLFIFFSDHGNRLTKFSYQTELGKQEKYSPFLSIRLPNSLHESALFLNAQANRQRLITAWDVFQTLRHFLFLNVKGDFDYRSDQFRQNKPYVRHLRGISIFEEIPSNRSCVDAMIPDKQCPCYATEKIPVENFLNTTQVPIENATMVIKDYLNNKAGNFRDLCAIYSLDKIVSIKKMLKNKIDIYQFVVIAQPGDSWFEANLVIKNENNAEIYGEVNRLSLYGKSANCMNNSFLRNFCYCLK
jgi:hypothetical protein